ncbi:aquaporin AQPAn.G-like isoform X2 [Bacillus rossius redtenbacheri]|uniref:aquaporin AQPAn.G-like isoform X2 n=1 Tax=Bacillus rossius redtenbacheri TaxID=93214 RepID=UPI002FDD45B2
MVVPLPTHFAASFAGARKRLESWREGGVCWSVAATIALAEFLGTALMVFFICMSGVVGLSDERLSGFQQAVAAGCTVSVVIQIFGHISSAHFNPAVTLAAVVLGKVSLPMAGVYLLAECGGAIVGYGFMQVLVPLHVLSHAAPNGSCCALCVTAPHEGLSLPQSLVLEGVATAFLVLMVCSCWDDRNAARQDSVALKFAFLIIAVSSILGPMTGASMNPARTLGPAVWTNRWEHHWIYWAGPMLGAAVASSGYRLVFSATPDRPQELDLPTSPGAAAKAAESRARESAVP